MTSLAPARQLPRRRVLASEPTARPFVAVLLWQLRNAKRSPLTWGVSLGALCALEVAIYPSVKDTLAKTLDDYPEPLREAFNITDMSTVQAFLDMEMFSLLLPLALAFFVIRLAIRGTAIAEDSGWLDILLAAPLARRTLVGATFVGTMIALAGVLAVIGVLTEAAGLLVGATIPIADLLMGLAGVWVLSMLFAGVAVLATGVAHRPAVVTAIASGALVTMYVIDLVGKLAPELSDLRYASAFHYVEGAMRSGLDAGSFAGLLVLGVAAAVAGALLFERRDVL